MINNVFFIYLALLKIDILLFLLDLEAVMTDKGKISCRNIFSVFLRIKSIEESKSEQFSILDIYFRPI